VGVAVAPAPPVRWAIGVLAVVSPGQGAQAPGFLAPWLELPGFAGRLRWASAVSGIDLLHAGTGADEEEIRDTAVAQPLLVAAALAAAAELNLPAAPGDEPAVGVVAGHSVGELAAAALAGAMSPEAALAFVAARGRAMAAAAAAAPTGMTALLGGDPDEVLAAIERHGLTAANVNGAGQVVAAGPLDRLDALAADPPPRTRLRRLSVAGAFHTEAMAPARLELERIAEALPVTDPGVRIVSNADGALVPSGDELRRRLVAQVSAPVRWDACMATLGELGVTAVIELPPAGTLTGLIRRALPGVETLALRGPADLAAARSLIASQATPPGEPAPSWRIVVAPLGGTFRPDELSPGARVSAGSVVGRVHGRSEIAVQTAHPGVLVEWLAHDGDPVGPGQPLARLHPEMESSLR
jgi:[acyl-carrier-protein] S-malonyltransferase